MKKIQIVLTDQEVEILNAFGAQFGYHLAKTLHFIISKAVQEHTKKDEKPKVQIHEKEDPRMEIFRFMAKSDPSGRSAEELIENDKLLHPLEWLDHTKSTLP
jgi:hypothetical protein